MIPPKVAAALFAEIAHELEANRPFAERMETIIAPVLERIANDRAKKVKPPAMPRVKRTLPPALDPVAVARISEQTLRDRLGQLSVPQLRVIITHFDMDKTKAASRWRKPEKFIEPIVTFALQRLTKGDVFLND